MNCKCVIQFSGSLFKTLKYSHKTKLSLHGYNKYTVQMRPSVTESKLGLNQVYFWVYKIGPRVNPK